MGTRYKNIYVNMVKLLNGSDPVRILQFGTPYSMPADLQPRI